MKLKLFYSLSVLAAACLAAHAESVVVAQSGKANAAVIQRAIDAPPAGRTYIGTVKPVGEFKLERSITLPDFTRLDLSEARLALADGVKAPVIANADQDEGNRHIEITGGVIDGNKAGQGMVCSRGSNWGAHNNSTQKPGKHADIFFDGNAALSYGISSKTVLNNITAGPYHQYGPASEKTAVEFGKGVREGLQINNLLELRSSASK